MPLPPLTNTAASWAAFMAYPNWRGVTGEQLVQAYNHFAPLRSREKETAFLYAKLERVFTKFVSRRLKRYDQHAHDYITKKAVTALQDGLIQINSSISLGLQLWFNITVKRRRLDAQYHWEAVKDKHPNLQFMSDPPDVPDPNAAGVAEAFVLFHQLTDKLDEKQRAALEGYMKGVVQAAAQMSERTRERYLASARKTIRRILGMEFAQTRGFETLPVVRPAITAMEVCLIGFSLACPQPSEDDVERWCRDFPQFAELIRECAEDIALDSLEISELDDVDA